MENGRVGEGEWRVDQEIRGREEAGTPKGWFTPHYTICLHFLLYLLNICRKFESLISRDSVTTCLKVRWVMSYDFVANFIRFRAVQKF